MGIVQFNLDLNENLYFGHPFSRETYTNSVDIKSAVKAWEADLSELYSGGIITFHEQGDVPHNDAYFQDVDTELRIIRGTKVLFIGGVVSVLEMRDDVGIYHDLLSKSLVRTNNPDYMDFSAYTSHVIGDPLKNIEDVTSIDSATAKKYMDYVLLYDKDKKHSDHLIIKNHFTLYEDRGIFISTSDFQDFNVNLKISMEYGVVGFTVQMLPNTSHYLDNYKEI